MKRFRIISCLVGLFVGGLFGVFILFVVHQSSKWEVQANSHEETAFPLDKEQSGMMGASTDVAIITKVVKEKDKYLYTYKLKNMGNKGAYCGWELMDLASYNGHGVPLVWYLDPGDEIVMTLRHEEAPVSVKKWAYIWNKSEADEKWDKHFAEAGVKIPKATFHHRASFGHPGPLPKSFLRKK